MWENALWYVDLGELWDLPYICEWDGPAGVTQRAKKIPADAVKYKGNYYKAYDGDVAHSDAQKRCELMGGHLVRVEDALENNFLVRLCEQFPHLHGMWLDGSDMEEEGVWRFSNGVEMNYFNWKPHEPNDNKVGTHVEISPFHADPLRGAWNDIPGKYAGGRGFICEWDE